MTQRHATWEGKTMCVLQRGTQLGFPISPQVATQAPSSTLRLSFVTCEMELITSPQKAAEITLSVRKNTDLSTRVFL